MAMSDPRSWAFPLGRLFGITIRVHWLFPVMAIAMVLRAAYGNKSAALPEGIWIDATLIVTFLFASVLLHEFGHSVYSSKNIPQALPYVLRLESHILTTEGVAMMFERMSKRGAFLTRMGIALENPEEFDKTGAKSLRYQLLIFSRWCQVMLRFEKSMYENPEQDLNKLWWDLVEKYQLLKRPEGRDAPDYASKIHIVNTPAYYHNYLMGELFACQVLDAMMREAEPVELVNPPERVTVRSAANDSVTFAAGLPI